MIESTVNKIIIGGIQNFSKLFNATNETTQIRVYFDKEKQVKYDACVNWQPKETVTFKQILNKKLDMLGYEALSTPIFKKSLLSFSEELNIEHNEISVFIFNQKNQIGLCVFRNSNHLHTTSLAQHLPTLLG